MERNTASASSSSNWGAEQREAPARALLLQLASPELEATHRLDAGRSGMASGVLLVPKWCSSSARTANSWSSHFVSHSTNCGRMAL
mmetsp:Transcript_24055/g.75940  ORF Transcript_24055/g.75940 Transcript_24055/m.75940 type:complete len:86 (-) Transcript_24055:1283-1540(-)